MNAFPTRRPAELAEQPQERRWLVEQLWSEQAVGIIGGEPKCGKSFLALDLAVAVATGTPCLRRFSAASGRVLLFAAEDAAHIVRERLDGIAQAAGTYLENLDIDVVPAVRLDLADDRQRLFETVRRVRPRLLVLDPLVRLHRIDENAAGEVAPLLACLRDLQRNFETAVVLVHHARKSAHARGGQALRGSSELHAWGDSNLYLRRKKHRILLTVEHRASRSPDEIALELRETPILSLQIVEDASEALTISPRQRIVSLLAEMPLSQRQIRDAAKMRASTVNSVLKELVSEGRVAHTPDGYCIAS